MTATTPRFSAPVYSQASVWLHWASACLVVTALGLAWVREALEESPWASSLLKAHRQVGLVLLVLTLVRLGLRARGKRGKSTESTGLLDWAALALQACLYGLLLALPLLGWAMTNAQGHELQWLGLIRLPRLMPTDPDWADSLQEWHESGADALMVLVGLHTAAALFHHLVLKDGVLQSMRLRRQPDSTATTEQ